MDIDKEPENFEELPEQNIENIEAQEIQPENVQEVQAESEFVQEEAPSNYTDDLTENENSGDIKDMITVRPVKFQEFEPSEPNRTIKKNLDIIQDVSMHISVELGRAKATIKEVMDYKEGSIVELDKIAGEQVEVYVNNKLVAKGEVIVIEDRFGVRVTSTNLPKTIL